MRLKNQRPVDLHGKNAGFPLNFRFGNAKANCNRPECHYCWVRDMYPYASSRIGDRERITDLQNILILLKI